MPFGNASRARLQTCDPRIIRIMEAVDALGFECVILVGHRGEAEQNSAFASGNSKLKWPQSKHNTFPSLAVDVAPYDMQLRRIPWPVAPKVWANAAQRNAYMKDLALFYFFAGAIKSIAAAQGVKIRWGGDWDGDHDFHDNTFDDLVHFEIVEDKPATA